MKREKEKRTKKNSPIPSREDMRRHVLHKSRWLMAVYLLLSGIVLFTLVRSFLRGAHSTVTTCLLTLVLFMVPAFVEKNFKLHLSNFFEGMVLVFIFCAEILGEIGCYYEKVPHWDTALHTVNGFMFAAFGFALLDMINRDSHVKFRLSPFYLAMVAFCFSMTVGVLWEFFEFGNDIFTGSDMQKDTVVKSFSSVTLDPTRSNIPIPVEGIEEIIIRKSNGETVVLPGYLDIGLVDTMKDLAVNFLGAVVFSVIGFFYVKQRGKGKFASRFIPVLDASVDKKKLIPEEELYGWGETEEKVAQLTHVGSSEEDRE